MNRTRIKSLAMIVTACAPLALSQTASAQRVSLTDIEDRLSNIENAMYVPFKVQVGGGVCNTAAAGSANPLIRIDGNATDGTFLVSSILVKTDDVPPVGFVALSLNSIAIDGTTYDTRTANLTASVGGTGVRESFDILGKPVSVSPDLNDQTGGGNVPHQVVANSAGSNDIQLQLFCRSDTTNFNIANVVVSGWKRPGETVTVTYVPGN